MTNNPQWLIEFPEFPESDMPELGEGWIDISWHNDVSPSFYNERLNLYAWIDTKDRSLWEMQTDDARILVIRGDHNGELTNLDSDFPLISGEEWAPIAEALKDSKLERDWICNRWTTRLGIGFHPDSEGANIKGLSAYEIAEFDHDMNRLFEISSDPYQDGLEAFARAGLIELN